MRLEGRCAIITGGADGIGKQLVEYLVSKGTNVIFGDISIEKGRHLSGQLNKNKKCVVFIPCDVRKESDLKKLFETATQEFGGAQILVNNAGIGPKEDFTIKTDLIDAIVDINLTAVLKGTSLAIQHFQQQQKNAPNQDFCVVNISSLSALTPIGSSPVYSATKRAVMYFSQTMGILAKQHIRVNCVLPYFAKTAIVEVHAKNPVLTKMINDNGGYVSVSKIIEAISNLIEDEKMSGDSFVVTPKTFKVLPRLGKSSL